MYINKNSQLDLLIQADCLENQNSGIFNYTKNITDFLIKNKKINLKLISLKQKSKNCIQLPKKNIKLYGTYRFYKLLPQLINQLNPKIFWQPVHLLPPFINKKIKKIITIHDLSSIKYPQFHNFVNHFNHKLLFDYSIQNADKILTVSNTIQQELIEYNPSLKNKIHTIYNGTKINPKIQKPKHTLPRKYFLYTGTIEPRKNLITLIKAFNSIKNNIAEHLILIGDYGWKSKEIHNLIQTNSKIHYLGFLPENKKNYIIKNATALIYPSIYEGFGLPILEAYSLKTPTIISDIKTFKELYQNSLFFNPYSIQELSKIMLKLSNNQIDTNTLKINGHKKSQELTWLKTSNEIEIFFKDLLSN